SDADARFNPPNRSASGAAADAEKSAPAARVSKASVYNRRSAGFFNANSTIA
ncbi:unnamed protein product, partial [Amoebophrya sp. A25]